MTLEYLFLLPPTPEYWGFRFVLPHLVNAGWDQTQDSVHTRQALYLLSYILSPICFIKNLNNCPISLGPVVLFYLFMSFQRLTYRGTWNIIPYIIF